MSPRRLVRGNHLQSGKGRRLVVSTTSNQIPEEKKKKTKTHDELDCIPRNPSVRVHCRRTNFIPPLLADNKPEAASFSNKERLAFPHPPHPHPEHKKKTKQKNVLGMNKTITRVARPFPGARSRRRVRQC
jgi:hypothetical protein